MIPPRPSVASRGPLPNPGPGGRPHLFRLRALRARFLLLVQAVRFLLIPGLLTSWHRHRLCHVAGPARRGAASGVVVVAPYYGHAAMLAAFLAHHRRLGVAEFVFLDFTPEGPGGLVALLDGAPGCAVWRCRGAHRAAHAPYLLNFLRRRYGSGRWVLSLEPWDLFVFHRCETRQINDLLDFLVAERRDHVYALVVDMYGEDPAATMRLEHGENPLAKLAWFDPLGYTTPEPGANRNVMVRGGVQRRTAFLDTPRRSPALNRIPLVQWRWFYAYVAGTRLVMPRRLNAPHAPWHTSPTVCLLRCALLDDSGGMVLAARVEQREILSDGGGLALPGIAALRGQRLKIASSMRYGGSEDLVECGLLNPGQWF